MPKKLIIILIIIFGLIISAGIYFYLKNKNNTAPLISLPEGKIAETVVASAKISADKNYVYYYSSQETPGFYRLELKSKKTESLSGTFEELDEINFSPDLKKVGFRVVYDQERFEKYGSPFLEPKMNDGEKRFWIYDFASQKLSYLSPNIITYVFSSDSKLIYYAFLNPDNKISLNQANADGSNYQKIADWSYGEPAISLLGDDKLLIAYSTEELKDQGDGLYLLNIKDKKLSRLVDKDFSAFFSLSPSQKNIFFYRPIFEDNQPKSQIWITDSNVQNKNGEIKSELELDFKQLAWSSGEKNIYLAAKENGKENFDQFYQYTPSEKKLKSVFNQPNSNFEAVGEAQNLIYYLLDSQLYAAKI